MATRNIVAKVTQQTRSTVVAQNFAPKPNVALTELTDVNLTSIQNNQVLQYNSATGKFVANTVTASLVAVNGGSF